MYKSIMGQNSHRSCHNFMSAWPGIRLGERCKRDAGDECSRRREQERGIREERERDSVSWAHCK